MADGLQAAVAEAAAALEGLRDSVLDEVAEVRDEVAEVSRLLSRMPSKDELKAMFATVLDEVLDEVRAGLTSAVPARDNHGREPIKFREGEVHMYMIEFHDDDRNYDLETGPFVERPTSAQAIAAVREALINVGFNVGGGRGFAWCIVEIKAPKPLPTASALDVELAAEWEGSMDGYTDF